MDAPRGTITRSVSANPAYVVETLGAVSNYGAASIPPILHSGDVAPRDSFALEVNLDA